MSMSKNKLRVIIGLICLPFFPVVLLCALGFMLGDMVLTFFTND